MSLEPANLEELTFEDAFARLEAAVARLEEPGLTVDELVSEFEAGMGLVRRCQLLLQAAQLRVEVLMREEDEVT